MALADRKVEPDTRSKFEKWLDSLNTANRAVVDAWLKDPSIASGLIADWIREDDEDDNFVGYAANKDTVAQWRRKNGITR